jgi:hypothetical protein
VVVNDLIFEMDDNFSILFSEIENATFEENADDCDYYALPDWWDNSNMILINTNKYSEEE